MYGGRVNKKYITNIKKSVGDSLSLTISRPLIQKLYNSKPPLTSYLTVTREKCFERTTIIDLMRRFRNHPETVT